MTRIRLATVGDALALAEIGARAWRAAYRGLIPDAFLAALDVEKTAQAWRDTIPDGESDVLVAEHRGAVAGFCWCCRSRDADADAMTGEIVAIYVDPDNWRAGLGAALMHGAHETARRRGFTTLTLWSLEGNQRARRFYESRKFQRDGSERMTDRWGAPVTEIRYRAAIADVT